MNTLRYAKKLEDVGFTRDQAEMTIGIINDVVESNLATKQDLSEVRQEIRERFLSIDFEMKQLKSDLTIRLGLMIAGGIGIIATLIQLT